MADWVKLFDTIKIIGSRLLRGDIGGIKRILRVATLFHPNKIHANFTQMNMLMFHEYARVAPKNPTVLPKQTRNIATEFSYDNQQFTLKSWQHDRNISAMLVLHNGTIVHEEYLQNTTQTDQRISWSMSKSILSATFGILHDQGKIPDLDTPIGDIVPELVGSAYETASIRNVLNMASGVAFNEDYLDYMSDINRMGRIIAIGGSLDAFAAGLKEQAWKPGTYSHYVSIDTHVIGMVMRALTGRGSNDLVSDLLFKPLGLEQTPYFLTDSIGEPFVLGGLNMTTRDYARFGLLFAQRGKINGTQIISPEWVKASTTPSAPPTDPETAKTLDGTLGYGYQWWVPPRAIDGEFMANGIYGQNIYVNTAAKTVIVTHAGDTNFRIGNGIARQTNIAVYRQIAANL